MQSRDSQRWKESEMSEMSIRGVFPRGRCACGGDRRLPRPTLEVQRILWLEQIPSVLDGYMQASRSIRRIFVMKLDEWTQGYYPVILPIKFLNCIRQPLPADEENHRIWNRA